MAKYDTLDRDALIRLLERRDADRQLGLVWERDEIDADNALNDDYVALQLDESLSHGDAPWQNLIIEGDNFDENRKTGVRVQFFSGSHLVAGQDHPTPTPHSLSWREVAVCS